MMGAIEGLLLLVLVVNAVQEVFPYIEHKENVWNVNHQRMKKSLDINPAPKDLNSDIHSLNALDINRLNVNNSGMNEDVERVDSLHAIVNGKPSRDRLSQKDNANNLDEWLLKIKGINAYKSENGIELSIEHQKGKGFMCRGMTAFMHKPKSFLTSKTIPEVKVQKEKVYVVIDNRSSCNNSSIVDIATITALNVTVESCCITNCIHTIELRAAEHEQVLLNFTHFNIPGLNLLANETVEECVESLEVEVDTLDKQLKPYTHKLGRFCGIKAPTALFVDYSRIKLKLRLRDNKQCVDKMSFVVNIIPCMMNEYKSCNSPDYVRFGEDHGYILSPGKDKGLYYPNNLNCEWNIKISEGKFIQLDVRTEPLGEGDIIKVLINQTHGLIFPVQLNSSNFQFRWPIVLPSSECVVKFQSDSLKSGAGFNISYMAVNTTSFIPMFSNHSLDCTQAKDVPIKLICNFHLDCAGGEDEKGCVYKNSRCWPGGYYFEESCYSLVTNQKHMSWSMAEEYCERYHNGHLVAINTYQESIFVDKLRAFIGPKVDVTFLGLRRMRMQQVSQIYRRMWQWTDGTTAFYLPKEYRSFGWSRCSLLHLEYFHSIECGLKKLNVSFICERNLDQRSFISEEIKLTKGTLVTIQPEFPVFMCISGELIFDEQQCDRVDNCFDHSDEMNCNYEKNEDTMFSCKTPALLPYSFVCDGINGCPDGSDEDVCKTPSKSIIGADLALCTSGMIVERSKVCNGIEDCLDGSDEKDCTVCSEGSYLCPMIACLPNHWITDDEIDCPIRDLKGREAGEIFKENVFTSVPPPAVINPDGFGKFTVAPFSGMCPETHIRCKNYYCIPVYMFCNGVIDCPYGDDENWSNCKNICYGRYKCKYSRVCISKQHLCDNIYHCPYHDDETLCHFRNITCPEHCECKRMEFTCSAVPVFNSTKPVPVHYLRINNAYFPDLNFRGITSYSLIYLNVSSSNVRTISENNLKYLNLRIFDVSHNLIENLGNDTFKSCPVLKTLILTHNKMKNVYFGFLQQTRELTKLDMSHNVKNELEDGCFEGATSLQELILRFMGIERIKKDAFKNLVALKRIDLRGNTVIDVSDLIFHAQINLREIATDNYRLCCDFVKPPSVAYADCEAPYDEISSCADILRTLLLRAALWIMAILTLVGNTGVIIYRMFIDRGMKQSFRIMITCLSASDLLMGIYLVIIGSADANYRDKFQLHEKEWTNSALCQAAGFLCLLSSETSALFILLVTVDRLLAIAFPMRRKLHFNARSATVACGIVWAIGLCMASIPMLPPFQHWQLYTQKAVGVPLPITRSFFPGYDYAFAILIVFNMVVFVLVGTGQLLIYLSVRLKKHPKVSKIRVRQDTAIAKRLILVVLSDCLCWFPITVMGVAARAGLPVPGEMNVVATVFLLPANSAFNPFLYTANAILMARKMRRKKKSIDSDMAMRPLSSS